jgi:hypothetical protein
MNIFSYVYLLLFVYMQGLLLSTAWIPALIRGLRTITPELWHGLRISTYLPAHTQITPYPKYRFTTTEQNRGLYGVYQYSLVADTLGPRPVYIISH